MGYNTLILLDTTHNTAAQAHFLLHKIRHSTVLVHTMVRSLQIPLLTLLLSNRVHGFGVSMNPLLSSRMVTRGYSLTRTHSERNDKAFLPRNMARTTTTKHAHADGIMDDEMLDIEDEMRSMLKNRNDIMADEMQGMRKDKIQGMKDKMQGMRKDKIQGMEKIWGERLSTLEDTCGILEGKVRTPTTKQAEADAEEDELMELMEVMIRSLMETRNEIMTDTMQDIGDEMCSMLKDKNDIMADEMQDMQKRWGKRLSTLEDTIGILEDKARTPTTKHADAEGSLVIKWEVIRFLMENRININVYRMQGIQDEMLSIRKNQKDIMADEMQGMEDELLQGVEDEKQGMKDEMQGMQKRLGKRLSTLGKRLSTLGDKLDILEDKVREA
jgi:ElaB/YqjD/DUF883 family membrane-anchored ribosome-binding protein